MQVIEHAKDLPEAQFQELLRQQDVILTGWGSRKISDELHRFYTGQPLRFIMDARRYALST